MPSIGGMKASIGMLIFNLLIGGGLSVTEHYTARITD